MATVRGLTAERMLAIEEASIVSGRVEGSRLLLTTRGGVDIDAGPVQGPQGIPGMPAGTISIWTSETIPPGWVEAAGQAIDRVQYSDLFSIIGSKYGNGDGANTFNVPDLRGRIVVGQDENDVLFDALNKIGGEKEHILTVNEMPSHSHSFTYQGSFYGSWPLLGNTTSLQNVGFGAGDKFAGADRPVALANVGGSKAHNNLQPYRVLKYIIKAIGGVGELASTVETVLLDRVATAELEITALKNELAVHKQAPIFQALLPVNQTLSGLSVWVKINFTEELVDRGDNYDAALSRFVAPVAGLYEFKFTVTTSTNSSGPGYKFYKNGQPANTARFDVMGYYDQYKTTGTSQIFELLAGDYMEVWFSNNNDSTVTLTAAYGGGAFSGKLV